MLLTLMSPACWQCRTARSATRRFDRRTHGDLFVDLNTEDETGLPWTYLDQAHDQSVVVPGRVISALLALAEGRRSQRISNRRRQRPVRLHRQLPRWATPTRTGLHLDSPRRHPDLLTGLDGRRPRNLRILPNAQRAERRVKAAQFKQFCVAPVIVLHACVRCSVGSASDRWRRSKCDLCRSERTAVRSLACRGRRECRRRGSPLRHRFGHRG